MCSLSSLSLCLLFHCACSFIVLAHCARRKYAKVEKIPGGAIEDSRVLRGVMFEKDVVVPARMRR